MEMAFTMIPTCFVLSIGLLWLQATIYSGLPILVFAPFLALASLDSRPSWHALFWSAGAGLVVDLLSSDPLGLHALTYTLSCLTAGRLRHRFSSETPMQFAVYTSLISYIATLIQMTLLFLFDRRAPFPGKWFFSEGLGLALIDGAYALMWIAGPFALYRFAHKWWTLHWLKKTNAS